MLVRRLRVIPCAPFSARVKNPPAFTGRKFILGGSGSWSSLVASVMILPLTTSLVLLNWPSSCDEILYPIEHLAPLFPALPLRVWFLLRAMFLVESVSALPRNILILWLFVVNDGVHRLPRAQSSHGPFLLLSASSFVIVVAFA